MNTVRIWLYIVLFGSTLVACSFKDNSVSGTDSNLTSISCIEVDIETLYETPQDYHGQQICTEGLINVEYQAMAIYPPALADQSMFDTFLFIDMPYVTGLDRGFRNRDMVRASGQFVMDEECFNLAQNPDRTQDWTCLPVDQPIYLINSAVELVERPGGYE